MPLAAVTSTSLPTASASSPAAATVHSTATATKLPTAHPTTSDETTATFPGLRLHQRVRWPPPVRNG